VSLHYLVKLKKRHKTAHFEANRHSAFDRTGCLQLLQKVVQRSSFPIPGRKFFYQSSGRKSFTSATTDMTCFFCTLATGRSESPGHLFVSPLNSANTVSLHQLLITQINMAVVGVLLQSTALNDFDVYTLKH